MNKFTLLLVCASLFFRCNETSRARLEIDRVDKRSQPESINSKNNTITKLSRLKVWTDSTRILTMPFRANFDTTREGTFRVKFWEADSIFRGDFKGAAGDVYLMGILEDTTRFYAFAFMAVAAVGNAGLVTFDKSGNSVSLKQLTKDGCVIYAGDVLLCKEYATIGKDWSLDYYFKSVVYDAGDSEDTVCSHFISKGQISGSGKIDLGAVMEIECKQ